jgi:hypothetical protein
LIDLSNYRVAYVLQVTWMGGIVLFQFQRAAYFCLNVVAVAWCMVCVVEIKEVRLYQLSKCLYILIHMRMLNMMSLSADCLLSVLSPIAYGLNLCLVVAC